MEALQEKKSCDKCGCSFLRKHRVCHAGTCTKCGLETKNLVKHKCVEKKETEQQSLDNLNLKLERKKKLLTEFQAQNNVSECLICAKSLHDTIQFDLFPMELDNYHKNYQQISDVLSSKKDFTALRYREFHITCSKCAPLLFLLNEEMARYPVYFQQHVKDSWLKRFQNRFQDMEDDSEDETQQSAKKQKTHVSDEVDIPVQPPTNIQTNLNNADDDATNNICSSEKNVVLIVNDVNEIEIDKTLEIPKPELPVINQVSQIDNTQEITTKEPSPPPIISESNCKHCFVFHYQISYCVPDQVNPINHKSEPFKMYHDCLMGLRKKYVPMAAINVLKHINAICIFCRKINGSHRCIV